jgi:hypothetical protein
MPEDFITFLDYSENEISSLYYSFRARPFTGVKKYPKAPCDRRLAVSMRRRSIYCMLKMLFS